MKKRVLICGIVIITILSLYAIFLMPLPLMKNLWEVQSARRRMTDAATRKVIGLPQADVIALLGESESSAAHFAPPGRALYYVLGIGSGQVKVDVFVVYLDENFVAVDCGIMKG